MKEKTGKNKFEVLVYGDGAYKRPLEKFGN